MSTQSYRGEVDTEHLQQNYQQMEWGASHQNSRQATHTLTSHQPQIRYRTDHYEHTPEEPFKINVDYSQVAAVQTGFKKLKSNQIQILKELKRQYQVLRNTQLEPNTVQNHRQLAQSPESNYQSSSKSISDARSSSFSRVEKTRKKSYKKELQVAALERKQTEMMLNNSMKKIQQLLGSEIQLKKTVAELRNRLESRQNNEEEHSYTIKKYRDEVESLTRALEESRRDHESQKAKLKQNINSIGSLEGQIAINHLQLKKKEERIRILQQEIYLEKKKFCNLELDLKKYKLDAEMLERNHNEELSLLQRRLTTAEEQHLVEKEDEIRKLKNELELKDERYRLILDHLNKEKEEKDQLIRNQVAKSDLNDKQYIKQLEDLVQTLKRQKQSKVNVSSQMLSSILEKMSTINSQSNQDLVNEIASLKKQLEAVHSHPTQINRFDEEELQVKIQELEKSIEEENMEKMHFFEEMKNMQEYLTNQRKARTDAQAEARNLKQTLRKVEEEANKYSYELQTLRHLKEIDMTEVETISKDVMIKSQMLQNKELQIAEIREDMNKAIETYRNQINEYEDELKILKRQIAEEEIKNYKIKEELELKLALSKAEYEAQINRIQEDLDKVKKTNANEVNDHYKQKITLEERLLEKDQELQRLKGDLAIYSNQRQTFYQEYKIDQDKKVKALQQQHTTNVNKLVTKLEGLAQINNQHHQLIQRNAWLEKELAELRRILRANRAINQGVDHLWSVKEAQYNNIDSILKAISE